MRPPPDGTGFRDGVAHYMRIVAADGRLRRDAVIAFLGWLVQQAGQCGALYGTWANLEDVADLYGDETEFDVQAKAAAEEWLALPRDDEEAERRWLTRWDSWLEKYANSHSPWFERARTTIRRLLLLHWDPLGFGHTPDAHEGAYADEARTVLALLSMGADVDEVSAYLSGRVKVLGKPVDATVSRVAAESVMDWYTTP